MAKLFKLDLPIVVFVNLFEELGQELVVLITYSKCALKLVLRDRATSIFVEQAESGLQFLLTYQVSLVHRSHHKLCVVN